MKFLDRQLEMKRLQALISRSEGGLAVVWGRRRIGKTRLLLEWCSQHNGLYTVADQSAPDIQRTYLAQSLNEQFPGFSDAVYPDWPALLNRITNEARLQAWHGPLIFDEFPYLAAASPELASQFQRWIDHDVRKSQLVVVLAGSSQRMMQGLVLDKDAPLYGRATELMEVKPLAPCFLRQAMKLTPTDCVRAYTVWGGVPRYWELAESFGADLDQAVDQCILDPLGPLHREPDRLLLEELPSAASLRPVLDVIGMGVHRISEIAGRLGKPATSLTHALTRLIELGLVYREQPFGASEKSGKRSLYKISDPFFRCWFRMVASNRALLAQCPAESRLNLWHTLQENLYAVTWEELCRRSVPSLHVGSSALAQYGPWKPGARFWHGNSPEWDIVAESLSGEFLLLGEAKWSHKNVSQAKLEQVSKTCLAKGMPPFLSGTNKHIVHAVIVPQTKVRRSEVNGVYIVTARDVIGN